MSHPESDPVKAYPVPPRRWSDPLIGLFLRIAASGWVPARWFQPSLPGVQQRRPVQGRLHLEIVSHCWNYSHLLIYQLSSLVNNPPRQTEVTMTVFYCGEDRGTADLLAWFGAIDVPGVRWNWRELPRQALFRRSIGRNLAALDTAADWIWFTDCDLMFRADCLDALADALQGRRDVLVFPRTEYCTSLLAAENPILNPDLKQLQVVDIDGSDFTERRRSRATGPLQIAHGDVARACGYCAALDYYQRPSSSWCKAHEDRAFRWLLRTRGEPLDIPGVYRIRHAAKGRYTGSRIGSAIRGWIRRRTSD